MPNSYQSTDIEEKIRVESLIISHQKANPSTQVLTKAKELEEAKAEMGEVREENERLKTVLQHIKNDYKSLQLRFFDIVKQDQSENLHDLQKPSTESQKKINSSPNNRSRQNEEAELVSLSLGRSSTPRDDQAKNLSTDQKNYDHDKGLKANDLTLGLGSETKMSTEVIASDESAENSSEDQAKELTEFPKKNSNMRNDNDEVSHDQQSQAAKRARVCVRARCDTPTMNDGCQWRKYGQKIAKGNPCPRAYYRCTVAPSCPVRKQVQRCAEDMSILITTYEGAHNHPLPVTATAMASTTSAAASMLLSGSSTSPEHMTSRFTPINASKNNSPTSTTLINNNGLNSSHFDTNFNLRPKPFYLPNNNSLSSTFFPTITLDLTASPISQSSSSHFMNKSSSLSSLPSSFPRIPSSSLSFSNNASELNNLPTLWGNGSSFLGYNGNKILPYEHHKASQIGNSLNLGRALQSQEFLHHHNHLHHKQANVVDNSVQDTLTETLTKAITADPSAFKSVIAAAISSVMGKQDDGGAERLGQRLTLGHDQNGKGLASSYFNGLPSSNF